MVHDQILFYLEKHNTSFKCQFGSRKGYSVKYTILATIENLKRAIDENRISCGIFLDFSKAFDTINHNILLAKRNKYGIRGLPLEWLSSYVKEKRQYVKIGNNGSTQKTYQTAQTNYCSDFLQMTPTYSTLLVVLKI